MQKKVSAVVRAFGRAHKAGLALLGGFLLRHVVGFDQ